MDKKYTVKDWRHGKIALDYKNGNIKKISSCKKGKLPYKLYVNGLLNEVNYSLIKDDQKDAFFTAVDLTVNTLVEEFKTKLKKAHSSTDLLNLKIEELSNSFNNSKNHIKESVYSGDWDPTGIDFLKYVLIKYPESLLEKGAIDKKPSIIHLSNPSKIPDDNRRNRSETFFYQMIYTAFEPMLPEDTPKPKGIESVDWKQLVSNDIYDLTVTWRFLKQIKQLKESIDGNTDQSKNSSYGPHQGNKDWIIKKFNEISSEDISQNKAAKKVIKLYKDKFGLEIGVSTILRYNRRV